MLQAESALHKFVISPEYLVPDDENYSNPHPLTRGNTRYLMTKAKAIDTPVVTHYPRKTTEKLPDDGATNFSFCFTFQEQKSEIGSTKCLANYLFEHCPLLALVPIATTCGALSRGKAVVAA